MYYADLSTRCQVDAGPQVRAVGWLGKCPGGRGLADDHRLFTVGKVDAAFVDKLREHIRDAWEPVATAGFHRCGYCRAASGGRNVWIPTKTLKYVAPELIVHYIEAHSYLPPQEFITAVTACPPQGSKAFFELLSGFENWWDSQLDVGELNVSQRADGEKMTEVPDSWTAGSTYEEFMGRWSRRLASQFVSWQRIPAGVHWLDVGCGTGALANAICSRADPASVVGCDPAEPFIEFARNHSADARISFVVAGVGGLPERPGGYGSVSSLLALNFFPNPRVAVEVMRLACAPQGTVSACVWDYSSGMEFLRHFWDAATALDPAAQTLDEGKRFPLCHPDALTRLFRSAELVDIRCNAIEIPTIFASFADFWQPFLGGTGPAPSYVASLDAERREVLARKLEETLPRRADGTIALSARAWAVRGTVSGLASRDGDDE